MGGTVVGIVVDVGGVVFGDSTTTSALSVRPSPNPTPMQVAMVGQEMPWGKSPGTGAETVNTVGVHIPPESVSINVFGSEPVRQPPIATQDVMSVLHETPTMPFPVPPSVGTDIVPLPQAVPERVSVTPSPLVVSDPTARHDVDDAHHSDFMVTPLWRVDAVHVEPDSVSSNPFELVLVVPQYPTAKQELAVKHRTLATLTVVEPTGSVAVLGVQMPFERVSKRAWVSPELSP